MTTIFKKGLLFILVTFLVGMTFSTSTHALSIAPTSSCNVTAEIVSSEFKPEVEGDGYMTFGAPDRYQLRMYITEIEQLEIGAGEVSCDELFTVGRNAVAHLRVNEVNASELVPEAIISGTIPGMQTTRFFSEFTITPPVIPGPVGDDDDDDDDGEGEKDEDEKIMICPTQDPMTFWYGVIIGLLIGLTILVTMLLYKKSHHRTPYE